MALRADRSRRRHVPLGERLTVVGRIRRGDATVESVAAHLEIPEAEILQWLRRHEHDDWTTISDIVSGSSEARDLERKAERLMRLVDEAELELRRLHRRVLSAIGADERPRRPDDLERSGRAC